MVELAKIDGNMNSRTVTGKHKKIMLSFCEILGGDDAVGVLVIFLPGTPSQLELACAGHTSGGLFSLPVRDGPVDATRRPVAKLLILTQRSGRPVPSMDFEQIGLVFGLCAFVALVWASWRR